MLNGLLRPKVPEVGHVFQTVLSTITVALDLGDRLSRYSEMDFENGVIAEGRLRHRSAGSHRHSLAVDANLR